MFTENSFETITKGSKTLFKELSSYESMDLLQQKINRFLRARLSDEQLADDLTQDTLLKFLTVTKKRKIENPEAWTIQVAKNKLMDYYRSKNQPVPPETPSDVEYDKLTDEILKCQELFISRLDDQSKYLIKEIDIGGRAQKDLAVGMNIPYPSLRSKIQRARKKIKIMFDEACDFEYDAAGKVCCCWEKNQICC